MRTRTLWLVSVLVTVNAVLVPLALGRPRAGDSSPGSTPTTLARAVIVLHEWDARRAAAWGADDARALRALYVPGSSAGRHDLVMLAAYHRRGIRVTGMRRQLLSIRVLAASSQRWSLEVTDRLVRARARGDGAGAALPRSEPATHRIVLRQVAGRWRVLEVYAV